MLDTPERIASYADQIYTQTVVAKAMPFGNKTQITEEERDEIARWYRQGANTEP